MLLILGSSRLVAMSYSKTSEMSGKFAMSEMLEMSGTFATFVKSG